MFEVEFQPTPFAACYGRGVSPRDVPADIVQRYKIIERFEFKSFFDRQSCENAMTILVYAIQPRKLVNRETHAISIDGEKRGPLERVKPQRPLSRD
jgi:hypothetical protein